MEQYKLTAHVNCPILENKKGHTNVETEDEVVGGSGEELSTGVTVTVTELDTVM
jgi:hypothetical protein